jgi:hypothetical protein
MLLGVLPLVVYVSWKTQQSTFQVFGMSLSTFVIVICGATFWFFLSPKRKAKRTREMATKLRELPNFDATKQVMGCDGKSGIAVDETRKRVCVTAHDGRANVSARVFSYSDIISSEIFENGTSITKTSRTSQVGGAVVGGLVLGGVGAMIGGLSGKQKTTDQINRIDLRLTVNDTHAPVHDVAFLNIPVSRTGFLYESASKAARGWHGYLDVLVRRTESEANRVQTRDRQPPAESPRMLVADEIKKLADLVKSGALTVDEFKQQKAKLIGSSRPAS